MKLLKYISEIKRNCENMSPISVCVYPTNRCSCKCKMCGIHKIKDKQDINRQILINTLGTLDKLGTESVVFIGGGEPTLYKGLEDILIYIEERTKLKSGILTNGVSNFNFELASCLHSVKFIRFSIDAVNDNLMRKIRGANFSQIEKNMFTVNSSSRVSTRMNSLIMSDNIDHLQEMIKYANRTGLFINFTIAIESNEYKNQISLTNVKEVVSLFNYFPENHNLEETIKSSYNLMDNSKCIVPLIYCVIDSTGDVYPCTIAADGVGLGIDKKELKLGNINETEFGLLWAQSFQKRFDIFSNPQRYDLCRWCSDGGINTCKLYVQYRNEYSKLMSEYEPTFL